jgi:hypothetical protein
LPRSPQKDIVGMYVDTHRDRSSGRTDASSHRGETKKRSSRSARGDRNSAADSDGSDWLHSDEEAPEVDTYKTSTELAMARMVAGQRESTVIASVAARTAAELKTKLAKAEAHHIALQKKISDGLERERALTLSRSKLKMEVRELKYRNTYLVKEAQEAKELEQKATVKTRARLESMANALSELEDFVGSRARAVQREVRHLKALLSSLQRHMSRGYVSSTSQTGQRLITSLWQTAESIVGAAGPEALPKAGMQQAHVSSFRKKSNLEEDERDPLDEYEAKHPKHDLATTMDGIVSDLEQDNRKLRAELEVARHEILVEKENAKDAAIIPQYRSAVRRARAHAESLRQRLATEIRVREQLQERLVATERDLRHSQLSSTANAERSVMADANAANSHRVTKKAMDDLAEERAEYQKAYQDLTQTSAAQQKLIQELQRIIDDQRDGWDNSVPPTLYPGTVHTNNMQSREPPKRQDEYQLENFDDLYDKGRAPATVVASSGIVDGIGELPGDDVAKLVEGDDASSVNSSLDNHLLAENAQTTVAALNHDLENLDSEIAVLQQSLKRIVTGPAPTEGAVPTAWGSGTREAPAAVDYEQPTKEVEL